MESPLLLTFPSSPYQNREKGSSDFQSPYDRHTVNEFLMSRFMMEVMHAEEGPQETARQGGKKKGLLGDPPAPMNGFPLIQPEDGKGQDVYEEEIKKKSLHPLFPAGHEIGGDCPVQVIQKVFVRRQAGNHGKLIIIRPVYKALHDAAPDPVDLQEHLSISRRRL